MIFKHYIYVFFIAMLPFFELRAAIPIGLGLFKLNWFLVLIVSILGNMVPVIFILKFLDYLKKLGPNNIFSKVINYFLDKTAHRKIVTNYYGIAGFIFVISIPIPFSGAWTGSLVSYLLSMRKLKAFFAILAGVTIAGILVTLITLGFIHIVL
jgi:uncharacterized membrane protein